MSEKIWEEIKGGFMEGVTDMRNLCVDLITAPFVAIWRVTSDFIHSEGRYKHPDPDSSRKP